MAVTLLHTPGEISFSRNPMVFEFQSDRYLADAGSVYLGYIYFFNDNSASFVGPAENSVLVLKMYNTTEVFTFKNGATGENNELPTKLVSETVSAWIDRVILAFCKNFTISNYYQLSHKPGLDLDGFYMVVGDSNHYIEFKSIERDEWANLELTNESVTLAGQGVSSYARSVVYEVNLRIYTELWVKDKGDYKKLISTSLPTDKQGKAKWDVSIPLTDFLLLSKTDLSVLSVPFKPQDSSTYYLRYTEIYGESLSTGDFNQSGSRNVLYGGQTIGNYINGAIGRLLNSEECAWLTYSRAGESTILPAQIQWLSWVNFTAVSKEIVVKARVQYANGSYWEFSLYSTLIEAYDKITIPVSVSDLDRDSIFPEQKIISYSVYIESNTQRLSPDMCFIVNYDTLPYVKVWAYRNSYGCYETIYTSGEKSYSYDIDKYSAQIIGGFLGDVSNSRTVDYDVELQDRLKINTGYKSKYDIEQFRDFFLSAEKYLHMNDSWQAVNIDTTSIEEYSDSNMLYGLSFDVSLQSKVNIWGR